MRRLLFQGPRSAHVFESIPTHYVSSEGSEPLAIIRDWSLSNAKRKSKCADRHNMQRGT